MEAREIRDFREGDRSAILEMFQQAFGRPLPPEFWDWRYRQGLYPPLIKLMLEGDKLIGHYAVTLLPFLSQGKEKIAALSMTTMTHPAFQGQGIFSRLAQEAYQEACARGVFAVYGFPNKNSESGFFGRLGWYRALGISEYSLLHPKSTAAPLVATIREPHFDAAYDHFWQKTAPQFAAVIPRTRQFLQWRIADSPPSYVKGEYQVAELREQDRLKGFLILKTYRGDQAPKAHILELMGDDAQVVSELLAAAILYAEQQKAVLLSTWLDEAHPHRPIFLQRGFQPGASPVVWGGKLLAPEPEAVPSKIFDHWHLSMLDSDVY